MTLDQFSSNIKFQWCFLKKGFDNRLKSESYQSRHYIIVVEKFINMEALFRALLSSFRFLKNVNIKFKTLILISIYICYHKHVFF